MRWDDVSSPLDDWQLWEVAGARNLSNDDNDDNDENNNYNQYYQLGEPVRAVSQWEDVTYEVGNGKSLGGGQLLATSLMFRFRFLVEQIKYEINTM